MTSCSSLLYHCYSRRSYHAQWTLLFALSVLALVRISLAGSVIPPAWAIREHNPCAAVSWQQVMWPSDGRCYPIFRQGPCPASQELVWHAEQRRPVCSCPRGHLLHADSKRCYRRYSRGPCPIHHFFDHSHDGENHVESIRWWTGQHAETHNKTPTCHPFDECSPGHVFWPPTRKCHKKLTRGPCNHGELLFFNGTEMGEPQCGCHRSLMTANYWSHTDSCYEQYTRGPCVRGLVFVYSTDRERTQCVCRSDMVEHYHAPSGQCHQPGTRGPCPLGAVFYFNATRQKTQCLCKPGALLWLTTGRCHHAYTQGPCSVGEFITPRKIQHLNGEVVNDHRENLIDNLPTYLIEEDVSGLTSSIGHCSQLPCDRGELYFPERNACYRIGRRGPCPLGQLVMYEQFRGVSQRGACGCSPDFTHNYWPPDGHCYQLYTRGPCPPLFTFVYNSTSGQPQCVCDGRRGRAIYGGSGQCHELYRRGPCPPGQTLSRSMLGGPVACSCRSGLVYDSRMSRCRLPASPELYKDLAMMKVLR